MKIKRCRVELVKEGMAEYAARGNAGCVTSSVQARHITAQLFKHLLTSPVERFEILTLNTKHRPINVHNITQGTLDTSLVHPREVFLPAIIDMASAVVLVHNHPSGDPTPSKEDCMVTDRLEEAGKLLGLRVLDHIVVAPNDAGDGLVTLSIKEHR